MANESTSKPQVNVSNAASGRKSGDVLLVVPVTDGKVAVKAPLGTLKQVDVADVDLLLTFEGGQSVVIPNGALDALGATPPEVVFPERSVNLGELFKLVGVTNPAKAGSLRLVTENIDANPPPAEERIPDFQPETPPPLPAPMTKVALSAIQSVGKGPGNGGNGTGEDAGQIVETIQPQVLPTPPVFRFGQPTQSIEDLLNGIGIGQPNVQQSLYVQTEFKVTPSGRSDLPAGAYNPTPANDTENTIRAESLAQSTRENINGTAGDDVIGFNPAFNPFTTSLDPSNQWAKTLHVTINNFSDVSQIQLVVAPAAIANIPGFNIVGAGVSRVGTTNAWNVTYTGQDMLLNGFDVQFVYDVIDGAPPRDFVVDLSVSGTAGPLQVIVTNNLYLTYREVATAADFDITNPLTGGKFMVLPSNGVGVEIFAGDGNDTVNAGAGADIVRGGLGNDVLNGGKGNDILEGGAGADQLNGGGGSDTATYENAAATVGLTGLTVRLDQDGFNSGEALGDQLAGRSVENLTGSAFNDLLVGDDGNNVLSGGLGDDRLIGNRGINTLNGGGGSDTVSYETTASNMTVNLTTNLAGDNDGLINDTLIAVENVVGGNGNDIFIARSQTDTAAPQLWISEANRFDGGVGGTDTVSYSAALIGVTAVLDPNLLLTPRAQTHDALGDTFNSIENLTGSSYDDFLSGTAGINVLNGGFGDDTLEGFGGGDSFIGGPGPGSDTVTYANSTLGVVATLTTLFGNGPAVTQTNDALGDTFDSIENLIGSGGNDQLIGQNNDNWLQGGSGDDILEGMAGSDRLWGGDGNDTASYEHSGGVVATLTTGLAGVVTSGDANGDTYDSIENLLGSNFNDTLIGNADVNRLTGGSGDDVLIGLGGADILDGGTGENTVSYEFATGAVSASLVTNGGTLGDADGDVFVAGTIQNLRGTEFGDTLTGNASNNKLFGRGGDDILSGGAGQDTIDGGDGNDDITDDMAGNATITGGSGDDVIRMTSADNQMDTVNAGSGIDTLIWDSATPSRIDIDLFVGTGRFYAPVNGTFLTFTGVENFTANGNNNAYVFASNVDNVIRGGSTGSDWVDYRYAIAGINASLETGIVTGGSGNDTLIDIENIWVGSQWDDVLTGNAADNTIRGYYGSDIIDGKGGNDTWLLDWSGTSVTASLLTVAQNAEMGIVMTAEAAGDVVTNMENISASAGDFLYGNAGNNVLTGRGLLEGFLGADQINGTGSVATASYANAGSQAAWDIGITTGLGVGVTASLTAGLAGVSISGDAVGDTYTGTVNNITGSAFADALYGNAAVNTINGGAGDDIMEGFGGADVFLGGSGSDTVIYTRAAAGITADLTMAINGAAGTDGFGDQFFSIENLIGSNFNDLLYGDGNNNVLDGGGGTNTLDGRGGIDTASYLSVTGVNGVTINLATNTVSGAGRNDTLISIERVIGTNNADTITGSASDDWIDGGAGADVIDGAGGNNTISYASLTNAVNVNLALAVQGDGKQLTSFQNIYGSNNALNGDVLTGDANNNVIEGGLGNDTLDGAGGIDTVSYATATAGVTANISAAAVVVGSQTLAAGRSSGAQGVDILSNFENITGSAFADILVGDAGDNRIEGGDGDDLIFSGGGSDTILGGSGVDTLSFANLAGPVTAVLGAGNINGIENLTGSAGNDSLTGDGNNNVIEGGDGNDTLAGGNNTATGDTVSYASASGGVTVNFGAAINQATGAAGTDQLSQFENILGSAFADTLTGDGLANIIEGGAGNDVLTGGGGVDTVAYTTAGSSVNVNISGAAVTLNGFTYAANQATGGADTDTLSGFTNITGSAFNDVLIGGTGNNTLDGGAGNDLLVGGAGGDVLIGGAGNDTVSYANASSSVRATLGGAALTQLGDALGDTFNGIENLVGSDSADILYGDANANVLTGGLGNDDLRGFDGNDIIDGRQGRDTMLGGNGDDVFWVDASDALNLPTSVNGEGNTSTAFNGGDTIKLFNLVNGGSYSLTSLAGVSSFIEYLDVRDGVNTTFSLTSLDVRNFVDAGNPSQFWIRANNGDSLNLSLAPADAGGSIRTDTISSNTIDYTFFNASGTQVAQIHWQTA